MSECCLSKSVRKGNLQDVQKGRDDQAEMGDMDFPKKVAELFGVDCNELFKAFCKPKIKVKPLVCLRNRDSMDRHHMKRHHRNYIIKMLTIFNNC